jgi:hypothetical protein
MTSAVHSTFEFAAKISNKVNKKSASSIIFKCGKMKVDSVDQVDYPQTHLTIYSWNK